MEGIVQNDRNEPGWDSEREARLADYAKRKGSFKERVGKFFAARHAELKPASYFYMREICGPPGREVLVKDPFTGRVSPMLMFGSNNYLGLANHPKVNSKVCEVIDEYGSGLGGPPLLNGMTALHRELESKLAEVKNKETAVIFSSGYLANIGVIGSLASRNDLVLLDELCHASLIDSVLFHRIPFRTFRHNDMSDLRDRLMSGNGRYEDIFVITEGVFSMDGDIAPIDEILLLKQERDFCLVVDDAHGLGVIGEKGHGVHEHFNTNAIDVIIGTFSKTLAVTGGFVACSEDIAEYIRYFARSYMFSASLPPTIVAAVLAGLELIEEEPWRLEKLQKNARELIDKLAREGVSARTQSAIVPILVPPSCDMHSTGRSIHNAGIFLNSIEFPAVPEDMQRFRVSVSTQHTPEDIDTLVKVLVKNLFNH